ncbi:DUF1697 domain-containing protein [Chondrinema litorale]|uniref:DUF1697 domain-containing protein n=1 Tax=Chondrinema litorale TaxID=2994555 RepID=UPI0025429F2F|nr:DUF1697 domain-containing protein [Chondrinema litorale]UZR97027.1 DUF1697 domain-containing protein [Chondrinema litorale]
MFYIALLRGINVSGQKKIKMAELKTMFIDLKLDKVQTYIQSGNVIFESNEKDSLLLAEKIKAKILDTFGFDVDVFVYNKEDFAKRVNASPFKDEAIESLYFTFLSEQPKEIPTEKIEKAKKESESIHFDGDTIYLCYKEGYGKSKVTNNFFEQKLKLKATTRNWKTSQKLLEMIKQAEEAS